MSYKPLEKVKTTQGKLKSYLGRLLKGQVSVDMIMWSMINYLTRDEMTDVTVASPWCENLFKVTDNSLSLRPEEHKVYF